MTDDQGHQFNLYGCVSRSIIKVTEIRKTPISKHDFVARYSHLFPQDKCGILSTDQFCDVVKDLGLTKTVFALRNISIAKDWVRDGLTSHVFVLTDTLPNKPDPLYHCRLATGYGMMSQSPASASIEGFNLYSPQQDGSDLMAPTPFVDLESQLVHFLLLSPND